MSSILKVDQLQDSGGNAIITSDGSGNLTAGTIPAKTIGTGAVLQVVQTTYSTNTNTNSNVYSDVFSGSITPSSTSSKILVIVHLQGVGKSFNDTQPQFKLLRNTTDIHNISSVVALTSNSNTNYVGTVSTSYLDSPSTTSSTSYKIQFRSQANLSQVYVNNAFVAGDSVSSITLMEIAG